MSKKSYGNENSYKIPYAIRKEDVGHYGLKKEMIIYRHNVPVLMVPTDNVVIYEECRKEFDKNRKQDARKAKCVVFTEFGNYARCTKNCKSCCEENPRSFVYIDDVAKANPDILLTEEPDYEKIEYSCTFDQVMKKLAEIKPKYAEYIIRYCINHESIEKIAKSEHKAKSTIHEQLNLAAKLAKKIFEGEI